MIDDSKKHENTEIEERARMVERHTRNVIQEFEKIIRSNKKYGC